MKKISLLTLFALSLCAAAFGAVNPMGMDTYTQEITIKFDSEKAASKAVIEALPLFQGYDFAITNRWDDFMADDLKVREVMEKYGFKGTFMMTGTKSWQAPAQSDVTIPEGPMSRALLAGGNSIGGHTVDHEYFSPMNRNKVFYQIMQVRVDREADSQSPINSFGFPFLDQGQQLEGEDSFRDIFEMIKRAGYYQIGEEITGSKAGRDFLSVITLGVDGQPIDDKLKKEMKKNREYSDKPLFMIGYHPWVKEWGGKDFPKLSAIYKKWGNKESFWYCNMNEYAAYRYQYLNSSIKSRAEGDSVIVTLTRPCVIDLNSSIPLSFRITGIKQNSVASMNEPARQISNGGIFRFDLYHDASQKLPQIYGAVENPANSSEKLAALPSNEIAGLDALLYYTTGKVSLYIKNSSDKSIENVRIAFRLPLKWKEGVLKEYLKEIKAGEEITVSKELTSSSEDYLYESGKMYFSAQVDFTQDNSPKRFYAGCEQEETRFDASYPRDGFLRLGPIPLDKKDFDGKAFYEEVLNGSIKKCYTLFDDVTACWEETSAQNTSKLSPDNIFINGKTGAPYFYEWDKAQYYPHGKELVYILWTKITSEKDREARAIFLSDTAPEIIVNNRPANNKLIKLLKGVNDVKILAKPGDKYGNPMDKSWAGMFFRLVDEKGNRVKDIRYERPGVTGSGEAAPRQPQEKPQAGSGKGFMLDDFEAGSISSNLLSGAYMTWANPGSVINKEAAAGGIKGGYCMITGDLSNGPWSTATLMSPFDPSWEAKDLRGTKGLRLYMKGKKGTGTPVDFMMQISCKNVTDYSFWRYSWNPVNEWKMYEIPWSAFAAPGWGSGSKMDMDSILENATAIQFVIIDPTGNQAASTGNVWCIDQVEIY